VISKHEVSSAWHSDVAGESLSVRSSKSMPANLDLTIRSSADLAQLGRYARGPRMPFRAIRLAVPGLTEAERTNKEAHFNRLYFSCGCAEATVLGLAGLVGVALWITFRPGGWATLWWWDLVYALGAFFLASGLGKWFGLQRARLALSREIMDLSGRLGHDVPPAGERARCAVS
jgi:hypothetical protein